MANVSRTVDIIFNADDKVTKAVKNISASLEQMDRIAMKIVDPFAKIGKGIIAADAALAGLAAGGMALSIKAAGEFNDSFAEISTLMDASAEDLEKFRTDILGYATDSTQSLEQITAATYTALSAGVDYRDSLEAVSRAEELAVAGRADLESTTRLLASTMNAYGASAEDAQRFSGSLFQTVRDGLTTIPELANSMAQVSTIAAQAGIPIETLNAAIATLTAAGLPTEKAMTALRTAIGNIIDPSQEAETAAKNLKIQFDAAALKAHGFEGIMQEVFDATEGNVDEVAKLFGNIRGLSSALVLANDVGGKFTKNLANQRVSITAASDAYQKMVKNFELVNRRLLNNINIIMLQIGSRLLGGYSETVTAIIKIFQNLSSAINEGVFNDIFKAFDNFGDKLSEFLGGIAEALPEALAQVDFTEFLDALDKIGVNVLRLFDGIDLTDPENLTDVIQDIVDTVTGLVEISGGMIEVFGDLFLLIKSGIQDFSGLDAQSKETFGKLLAGSIILQEAGLYLGAAIISLSESGVDLKGTFEFIADSIKFLYNAIQADLSRFAITYAGIVYGLLTIAEALTFGTMDFINNARTAVGEFVVGGFESMQEHAAKAISVFTDGEKDVETATNKMTEHIERVGKEIEIAIPDSKIIKTGAAWDKLQAGIVQEQIDKDIPAEREVKVRTALAELESEKIKRRLEEEAKIMEKTLELQAEIDIAQIEADTERIKAAFESINEAIGSTGDVITSLFGELAGSEMDFGRRFAIEEQIRNENERREASLDLQRRLTEAQIAALQARISAMQRGDPLITVNAEGLEPHLEAIFFYILEQIQIRVNEDQQEFLLGINP